ncbi:hypothetical protein DM43_2598 [Burkholderia cepacia]|uniref:Uncharacterized protein n=1 Tax=Burkholderia cepacia TaxID=292 RepID=A0AA88Z3F1_BURCE|nr:hypothetical protein DM43_2598 [Burkholderia cepacia]
MKNGIFGRYLIPLVCPGESDVVQKEYSWV